MNPKYRRLKGTRDILLEEVERWRWCEERWEEVLARYGYGEIRTPIIESTDLFLRSVGEGTDIVDKEMYTFETKGGESLTLRPEMTASVARAYLENGLSRQPGTVKFYYIGPMFRHDRPQAGRYRQFHQVGIEAIGSASPVLDAEVIQTALACFDAVDADGLQVLLNATGCTACRPAYLDGLRVFLRENRDRLPEQFRRRSEVNPLRLYDAKDETIQALLAEHPPILISLCDACREHHAVVRGVLDDLRVDYQEDPTLVRGLDYYTRTTFEITAERGHKRSSLCGGGRYDDLLAQCGGAPTPAIGFSIGIERTLRHLGDEPVDPQRSSQSPVDVYVACRGTAAQRYALVATDLLRGAFRVEIDTTDRSLKAQLKSAAARGAGVVLIAGEDEMANGQLQLKNLETGVQFPAPKGEILAAVREVLG